MGFLVLPNFVRLRRQGQPPSPHEFLVHHEAQHKGHIIFKGLQLRPAGGLLSVAQQTRQFDALFHDASQRGNVVGQIDVDL